MKNIENEYNKRFKNQKMDNSDFDTDGLWDAISKDLPAAPTPPKNRVFLKYLGFGLVIILISFSSLYFLSQGSSTQGLATKITKNSSQITNNQEVKKEEDIKKVTKYSSNKTKSTTQINSKNSNNTISSSSKVNSSSSINTLSKNRKSLSKKSDSPKIIIKGTKPKDQKSTDQHLLNSNELPVADLGISMKTKSIKHITSSTKGENNATNKTIVPQKNNSDSTPDLLIRDTNYIGTGTPNSMSSTLPNPTPKDIPTNNLKKHKTPIKQEGQPKLDTDYTFKIATSDNKVITQPDDTSIASTGVYQLDSLSESKAQIPTIKPTNQKNIHWEVNLVGGVNKLFLDFKPNNDLSTLRNSYEKGTWGTSFGVNASMIWKNQGIISTGLEYHTLWSKLDYSQEITKTQDSVLRNVLINPNGQILSTTYDSLTKTFRQKATWNNQYTTYRIPLEIGYQKYIKKWTIGAKAGVIFNITATQKGKTFNSEKSIAHFSKESPSAPLKSFQIGFRFSPFVGYQITDKTTLRFDPKWNLYKGQTADIQEIGLGIGIGINF